RGVVIGHTGVADLALVDQFLQRRGRLLGRGLLVGPVHLVQVDVVDPEVTQALLDAAAQVLARGLAGPVAARVDAALRGDDDAVAIALQVRSQRLAEQLLGGAESVRLRRVEEGHAELACLPDGADRRVLVERAPVATDLPGPEADPGHVQSAPAQSDRLHTPRITPNGRMAHGDVRLLTLGNTPASRPQRRPTPRDPGAL